MFYFVQGMMQQPVTKNEHIECMFPETDLFISTFVQTDIEEKQCKESYPNTYLDDAGPIEFSMENNTDKFITSE